MNTHTSLSAMCFDLATPQTGRFDEARALAKKNITNERAYIRELLNG